MENDNITTMKEIETILKDMNEHNLRLKENTLKYMSDNTCRCLIADQYAYVAKLLEESEENEEKVNFYYTESAKYYEQAGNESEAIHMYEKSANVMNCFLDGHITYDKYVTKIVDHYIERKMYDTALYFENRKKADWEGYQERYLENKINLSNRIFDNISNKIKELNFQHAILCVEKGDYEKAISIFEISPSNLWLVNNESSDELLLKKHIDVFLCKVGQSKWNDSSNELIDFASKMNAYIIDEENTSCKSLINLSREISKIFSLNEEDKINAKKELGNKYRENKSLESWRIQLLKKITE